MVNVKYKMSLGKVKELKRLTSVLWTKDNKETCETVKINTC